MKKKMIILFAMLLVCILTTGCMRFEIVIDVKENNKADLSVLTAVIDGFTEYSDEEILSQEDLQSAKENGWTVNEYNEDNYYGYLLTQENVSLDDISVERDANVYLNGLNGIFKNTLLSKNNKFYSINVIPFDDEQRSEIGEYADILQSTGGYARLTVYLPKEAEVCSASSQSMVNEKYRYSWNLLDSQDNSMITLLFKAPRKINVLMFLFVIFGLLLLLAIIMKIMGSKKSSLSVDNDNESFQSEKDAGFEKQENEVLNTNDVDQDVRTEEIVAQSEIRICPNCGMTIKRGQQFCTHCGKKYE